MLRKLVTTAVMAVMFLAGLSVLKPVYAAGDVGVYIVLRCTVTLSVTLSGSPTSFVLGDVSAGTTAYSASGVDIRNDSQGAISSWGMNISNAGGWTIDNVPGLDTVAIYGLFKKTAPVPADYDIVNDTFSVTGKRYSATAYSMGDYAAEGHLGQEGRILPYAYDPARSDRKLWIKMLTPSAVTDQNERTIILTVTAQMAG